MDYNWLYKDDSGASRGPHSGALINAWFKSGTETFFFLNCSCLMLDDPRLF